jgi:hypothetical protein
MKRKLILILFLVPISGCYRPCADGDCRDKILIESASRHDCGPQCEHVDLVVYCDGRYKYECLDCDPYEGKLKTKLLDELKQAVTNPFAFKHTGGIARYRYHEEDIDHRGRNSTMASVYRFVEGQYLSEPNQVRKTLSILTPGMTQEKVKALIPYTQQAMVLRLISDANNVSVLYYCPAGCETAAQDLLGVILLSALAGGNKDDKLPGQVFEIGLYRELTSTKNIPLIFKDNGFVGWGWDVYDRYQPRQKMLDEFGADRRNLLDKAKSIRLFEN